LKGAGLYIVMHSDRGYFIGRCELGCSERISEEFYNSFETCQLALRNNTWTRRHSICSIY